MDGCQRADAAPDTGESAAAPPRDIMSGAMLPEGGSKAASIRCLRAALSRVFIDAFEGERGRRAGGRAGSDSICHIYVRMAQVSAAAAAVAAGQEPTAAPATEAAAGRPARRNCLCGSLSAMCARREMWSMGWVKLDSRALMSKGMW